MNKIFSDLFFLSFLEQKEENQREQDWRYFQSYACCQGLPVSQGLWRKKGLKGYFNEIKGDENNIKTLLIQQEMLDMWKFA